MTKCRVPVLGLNNVKVKMSTSNNTPPTNKMYRDINKKEYEHLNIDSKDLSTTIIDLHVRKIIHVLKKFKLNFSLSKEDVLEIRSVFVSK